MGSWRNDQVWENASEITATNIQVGLARRGDDPPEAVAVMMVFEEEGVSRTVTALLNSDEAGAFTDAVTLMSHEIDLA